MSQVTFRAVDSLGDDLNRSAYHDLSGPLITAQGFSEELRLVRDLSLALLAQLPADVDPHLFSALSEQLDEEMGDCLNHIDASLAKLVLMLDRLQVV